MELSSIDTIRKSFSLKTLRKYFRGVIIVWTLLVAVMIYYEVNGAWQQAKELMKADAHANFNKDQAFRHWAASHGGVYVPITETTQPNQYLTEVAERDIETPSGKKLTLMNPAYMVRQFNESFNKEYGIVGHITSLKLLNPNNEPDEWETKALHAFEKGTTEVCEFTETGDSSYMRLMRPMFIKESCLKCHEHQGYKIGDVRGGVGVKISTSPYYAKAGEDMLQHGLALAILWLIGLTGIWLGKNKLKTRIIERNLALDQIVQLNLELEDKVTQRTAELETINKELKAFSYSVSHDLRAPLTRMDGFSKALQGKYSDKLDEKGMHYLDRIRASSQLMAGLIDDLLTLSRISRLELKKEVIYMSELSEEIMSALQATDKDRKADVKIQLDVNVTGDAGLMKVMMDNLLNNAWKYSGKEKVASIDFGKVQKDGKTWMFVKDNGIGFDMKYYDKLFTPFLRLHSGDYEGSGIGLSIVQRIISKHGGKIHAESEPGKGTTFYFII